MFYVSQGQSFPLILFLITGACLSINSFKTAFIEDYAGFLDRKSLQKDVGS